MKALLIAAGRLPEPGADTPAEEQLRTLLSATATSADANVRDFALQQALLDIKDFVDAVNLYVTEQQPWVVAKDEAQRERLATILYTVCECLRATAALYAAVMPKAAQQLWDEIGATESGLTLSLASVATWGQLRPGVTVTKGESMFPRVEEPESI